MIPLHEPILSIKDLFYQPDKDYYVELKNYVFDKYSKKNLIFTGDGRTALYLALKSINLNKKSEVLIPAYACPAVNEVVGSLCKVVPVDIDGNTYNIDPSMIKKNITSNTKAIIAVHLYGNPCKMDELMDISTENDLILIEDVAQALNGRYEKESLGSFGDLAIFSFRFSKDITTFKGGAILSNKKISFENDSSVFFPDILGLGLSLSFLESIRYFSPKIYIHLKNKFLTPILKKSASRFEPNFKDLSVYYMGLIVKQLAALDDVIESRRANADFFSKSLGEKVIIPKETENGYHTYYRYTIQSNKRQSLYNHLLKNGIEADIMYDQYLAPFTNSIKASKYNLNIPVHHGLTSEEREKIVETIHDFK